MLLENFEQPMDAKQELTALGLQTSGVMEQADWTNLRATNTRTADDLLGRVDLVEQETTASDNQLSQRELQKTGDLTTEQIERMLNSAARDINRNRINNDLTHMVESAARAGRDAMGTLLASINRRLANMGSEYRLDAALVYTPQNTLRGGLVFITRGGEITGQAISLQAR